MFSVEESYRKAVQTRLNRTIVGFIAGLILGSLLGVSATTGLVSGLVASLVLWGIYSVDVEEKDKIYRPKDRREP
jgi:hypothetical protein